MHNKKGGIVGVMLVVVQLGCVSFCRCRTIEPEYTILLMVPLAFIPLRAIFHSNIQELCCCETDKEAINIKAIVHAIKTKKDPIS